MHYSKSTNGFYLPEIHGDNIPSDAVEITDEQHTALLDGQSKGKIITGDEQGYPIHVDPPIPTPEQKLVNCTTEAKSRIAKTDWSVLSDVGLVNVAEFVEYRAILRNLILNPVADPVWPVEPQPVWEAK